ncbi:MAG: dihydroxy-acid dehydratase, partial [Deltaproteobacteria bacterium]
MIKDEIRKNGCIPFEFNTIGVDDGIAMGHDGMLYSLPSRELIANSIETVMNAHKLDAMICIPNCDKIVPGMIMGALRVNVPTVFVSGGPMQKGYKKDGTPIDLATAFEAVGKFETGEIDEEEFLDIECNACPSGGSCSGMFTANSMNTLMEAMGIALSGNGTILALTHEREELIRKAARRVCEIALDERFNFKNILNAKAVKNAFAIDMAMGGSSNTVLHMLAIAKEAGVNFNIADINDISKKISHIAKISPSLSTVHMEDIHKAGGMNAVMKEISKRDNGVLELDNLAVTGESMKERIQNATIKNYDVIHSIDKPYSKVGGLAVLFGNLAEQGCVIKTAGITGERKFIGTAVCFDSQDEAIEGITSGKIKKGDVVVIRYEGPRGGPGMQEMLAPTSLIMGMGLGADVALIPDGRFSGATRGL